MSMGILPATLAVPRPINPLFSSLRVLTGGGQLQLQFRLRPLSTPPVGPLRCPPVRMGGGPRTFPGGVSKWQWKRMQAKKAKQLLKARLLRERQIYEMRKRAELKAAVSELERPWEVVERAPNLFSVSADEQVKALADRFQRPGGFDMWTERDGPQLFRTPDGLPSARFFPKGAVHSVRPYGVVTDGSEGGDKEEVRRFDDWISRGGGGTRRRLKRSSNRGTVVDVEAIEGSNNQESNGAEEDPRAAEGTDPGANMASYSSSSNRHVNRRRQGFEDSPSSLDSDVMADAGEESGKMIRRGGYRNAQVKVGKVSLRPTRNLYSANGGGIGARDSTGNQSYSSSSNHHHHVHRRRQGLEDRPSSLDSNVMADTGEEGGRMIRRGGYRNRQVKVGKVSLRPTTDLYSEDDGSYGARDSARNGSYSNSGNRHVHRRRQGFEDSPSSLDSYVMADTGEESGKMIRRGGYCNGQVKVGKVSLRPTRNLYSSDGGGIGARYSTGNRSYSSSSNHHVHRRQQGLEDSPSSLDSNVMADTGEEGKGMIRRGGYRNRQVKVGKVSLRPTTDLYSEDGSGYGARDSAGNGSYSSSSNRHVHRRRQGFEDSPSSLDSYVMADTGEESGKMIKRGGYRNHQVEVGKVSLRPTTYLYSEDGGSYRVRDSAGNGRNGFRTNHPRR